MAREQPDGFRLLFEHAAREPQFAEYARDQRDQPALVADDLVGESIADRTLRQWATHVLVGVGGKDRLARLRRCGA